MLSEQLIQNALQFSSGFTLSDSALQSQVWVAEKEGFLTLLQAIRSVQYTKNASRLLLIGPVEYLPVRLMPARILIDAPAGVIGAIPLLEDWGIPHRCFSHIGLPGAFEGSAVEMLEAFKIDQNQCYWWK